VKIFPKDLFEFREARIVNTDKGTKLGIMGDYWDLVAWG
jgi:hypothetical protein